MRDGENRPERNKSSPITEFMRFKSQQTSQKGEEVSMSASQFWSERNSSANALLLELLRAHPDKIGEAAKFLKIGKDTLRERLRHNGRSRDIEGILLVEGYLRSIGKMPPLPKTVSLTDAVVRGISESKVSIEEISLQLGNETSAVRIWLSNNRVSTNWVRIAQLEWLLREKGVIRTTSIDSLHPAIKKVFILVYRGRVSVDQIAETLGFKRDSVLRYLTNRSQPNAKVAQTFEEIADKYERPVASGQKPLIEQVSVSQSSPPIESGSLAVPILSDDELISTVLLGVRITVAGLTHFLKKGRTKVLTQQRQEIARLMARDPQVFFDLQNVVDALGGSAALEKWRKESK